MKTKTTLIINLTILVISFVAAGLFWSALPEVMASHWNINDQVDGTMSKFWGVFLLPMVLAGTLFLFFLVPLIDPLKHNIESFRSTFNLFITLINGFMVYVYGLTIAWNLGARFNMSEMIMPGIGLIFIGSGYLISKAKRNYFIGIRTPWTLANDLVWDKTHSIGGKLFIATGVLLLLSMFASQYAFPIMMVAVFGTVIFTFAYSYFVYSQLDK
ncbi:MAG TPA: SdpI family protein [Anaerolineales bacterium]|nr:SdpI family protein [Anaerolineales bacterium]